MVSQRLWPLPVAEERLRAGLPLEVRDERATCRVRCSTDQQDLTARRDCLLALGVDPSRVYVDHGLTGTNRERPGLREALAACREAAYRLSQWRPGRAGSGGSRPCRRTLPKVIVVDACVLANAIGDDDAAGSQARDLLQEHRELAAPDLVDVETTTVLRRRWLAGTITDERFGQAIEDLADIPLARFPTRGLMRRAFDLRANVTAYDACYVALAEALEWPLCTADRRLARATGPRCTMRLIAPQR